jgi:hypothetical protein
MFSVFLIAMCVMALIGLSASEDKGAVLFALVGILIGLIGMDLFRQYQFGADSVLSGIFSARSEK